MYFTQLYRLTEIINLQPLRQTQSTSGVIPVCGV